MTEENTSHERTTEKADHEPPAGAQTTAIWAAAGMSIDYVASAMTRRRYWATLRVL